jgi:DNA-binding Lrp family transcriptional regulator
MPFTSVYHRISRLEAKAEEIAVLIPEVAKLGMIRLTILVAAAPGHEDQVAAALIAPNLWRAIGDCEGAFTHISTQVVPVEYLREFRSYVQRLYDSSLITNLSIIYTGDYVSNFPDFSSYDPRGSEWKFDWEGWLAYLGEKQVSATVEDPSEYKLSADKKDMLIIKELELDARRSLTRIAEVAGVTAQTVKSRYEKLVEKGIIKQYHFRVFPYPSEVAAYHQVMLEFNSKEDLERFVPLIPRLFWVRGFAKVLRKNALILETWILESQLKGMFSFFSHMVKTGALESYSAVRMDFRSRRNQTISYELFSDNGGWVVDLAKCSTELQKVANVQVNPTGRRRAIA